MVVWPDRAGWLGLLVLALTVPAAAQVRRVQRSHSLDSNFRQGSGGRNRPAPRFVPNQAGLTISGNVTGGRAFRGFSPIRDTSQLLTGVPSSTLSNFRRDSFGVDDVVAGRSAYRPQPFFAPELTITSASAIRAGLNRPGSSIPRSSFAVPRAGGIRPLGADLLAAQRTAGRSLAIDPNLPVPPSFSRRSPADEATELAPYAALGGRGFRSSASGALPGIPTPPPVPAAEIPGTPRGIPATVTERPRPLLTDPLENPLYREFRSGEAGTFGRLLRPRRFGDAPDRQPLPPSFDRRDDSRTEQPDSFQDAPPTRTARATVGAQPGARAKELTDRRPALVRTDDLDQAASLRYDRRWLGALLDRPIQSFVRSGGAALADKYVSKAEEYVRTGQYYRAAGQYEIARELDRDNPLPTLGKGQAMIGAGDFLTAAHLLQKGVALFPEIARLQIDLPAMMPHEQILTRRRADLEKRLAGTIPNADRYRLQFVLGYLEIHSGRTESGMQHLEAAAALAPEDSVIRVFPDRLRATPHTTTQPKKP